MLRKKAKELGAKYKVNPFPISQVMDEIESKDMDIEAVDWNVIIQDTKDLGITVDNLWGKLGEYYELTRPIEKVSKAELEAVEQRAAQYDKEDVARMLEDAVARVVEAERATISRDIYNELKEITEELPTMSKKAQVTFKAAVAAFEDTLKKRDEELKTKIEKTTQELRDAAEFTLKAEIGNLRAKLQEGLTIPKSRPALLKAQERLKIPPIPEEIVPEGYTRERIVTTTERAAEPSMGKEKGIIEFHEIPPDIAVFRAPDGRLFQVKDRKLKQITVPEILKMIYPRVPKPSPLIAGPGMPKGVIPLGVPIFMTPIARLDVIDVLKAADKVKQEDPEFYNKLKNEGKTLQEIVIEWRRLKGLQ